MAQAITTQEHAVTTQDQAMTTQANREVVPRGNKYVSTMSSHLWDFTKMNPPSFYGSKVEEDPKFIDETYNILYAMGDFQEGFFLIGSFLRRRGKPKWWGFAWSLH